MAKLGIVRAKRKSEVFVESLDSELREGALAFSSPGIFHLKPIRDGCNVPAEDLSRDGNRRYTRGQCA